LTAILPEAVEKRGMRRGRGAVFPAVAVETPVVDRRLAA
jgi:hypothetical protein